MPNKKITTSDLLKRLFQATNITRFIEYHDKEMKRVPFYSYINMLCEKNNIVPERIIKKSGIDRTYGHQIFSGVRKPSRDKVIQLALGFEMDYGEAQELLRVARKSTLYPRVERDAVLIYALNKRFGITDVQITLKDLNMPLLGKEDKYE